MFTAELLKQIKLYLEFTGRKDSQFPDAKLPINGSELLAFVLNGINVKMPIGDLFSLLLYSRIADFINVSTLNSNTNIDKFGSLEEVLDYVGAGNRKPGMIITFFNTHYNDWDIWEYLGTDPSGWYNLSLWNNLLDENLDYDRLITRLIERWVVRAYIETLDLHDDATIRLDKHGDYLDFYFGVPKGLQGLGVTYLWDDTLLLLGTIPLGGGSILWGPKVELAIKSYYTFEGGQAGFTVTPLEGGVPLFVPVTFPEAGAGEAGLMSPEDKQTIDNLTSYISRLKNYYHNDSTSDLMFELYDPRTGTGLDYLILIQGATNEMAGVMSRDDKIKMDGITTYMNDIGTNSRNENLVLFSKSLYNPFTNTSTTSTLEVPYATERYAGVMRSIDKAKLDSIQQGALANNNTFLTFNLNTGSIRADLQNALGSIYGRNGITTSGRGGTLSLIADIEGQLFTRDIMGMVPPPLGNTTNRFLREDGTWEVVESGGGGTTYTFESGTNGSFTVTPQDGSAQTVSVGKPSTAETADKVANALSITKSDGSTVNYDGSAAVAITLESGGSATDTTNTVGATNSTAKLFLVGAPSQTDGVVSNTNVGVYTENGGVYASLGFFDNSSASSDIRLKSNIKEADTNWVLELTIYEYDKKGIHEIGTMALDVELVAPYLVTEHEGVKYLDKISVLFAMINKLNLVIKELLKEIESIKLKGGY